METNEHKLSLRVVRMKQLSTLSFSLNHALHHKIKTDISRDTDLPRVFLAKIKFGSSPDFYTWTTVAAVQMEIDCWLAGLWLLTSVKIKNIMHRSFSCPKTSDNKLALPNFSHSAIMKVISDSYNSSPHSLLYGQANRRLGKSHPKSHSQLVTLQNPGLETPSSTIFQTFYYAIQPFFLSF